MQIFFLKIFIDFYAKFKKFSGSTTEEKHRQVQVQQRDTNKVKLSFAHGTTNTITFC